MTVCPPATFRILYSKVSLDYYFDLSIASQNGGGGKALLEIIKSNPLVRAGSATADS